MIKIQFPNKLEPLFKTDKRFISIAGGRASGKSWGAAGKTILNAAQGKRCVCCREIASSIDESMHTLLINTIERMKIAGFKITDKDFRHSSGGYIFFKGLKGGSKADTRTRIKSLEDVDWSWVEEAESMDMDTVQLFLPTIRKQGSQQCFTYNRYLPNDPIHEELNKNIYKGKVEKIFINYYDNPFCPVEEFERAERMKKDDYTLWLHIYGGEPINQDAQAIISRDKVQAAIDRVIEVGITPLVVGADIARYGDDKTVFYGRRLNKMTQRAEYKKQSLVTTCDMLEKFVNFDSGNCILNIDDTGLGCLTKNAQIMTTKGWISANKIKRGDKIYSKAINNNVTIEIVKNNIKREKTKIINNNGLEFSWSHFMPYKTRKEYKYKLDNFETIINKKTPFIFDTNFNWIGNDKDLFISKKIIKMPNGGYREYNQDIQINCNDLAEFLGWFISEGCIDNIDNNIKITQINKKYLNEIENILSKIGKWRRKNNDYILYNLNLVEWLKENCYIDETYNCYNKKIPEIILQSTPYTINIFLNAFMKGDGFIHHGSRYYVTSSEKLSDDLLECIYKIGKYGNKYIKQKKGSKSFIGNRELTRTCDIWEVFEYKHQEHTGICHSKGENKERFDNVYNITITGETKLFFTRIKGYKNYRAFWTHNGGVTDMMQQRGYNVNPYNFAQHARNQAKYGNIVSEMWFDFADKIDSIQLFDNQNLKEELTIRLWKMDRQNRRCVESKEDFKKRLGHSPDDSDACILCFYEGGSTLESLGSLV